MLNVNIFVHMNLSVEDGRITLGKPDERTCRVEVKNVGPKDEGLWKITLDSGLGVERDQICKYLEMLYADK